MATVKLDWGMVQALASYVKAGLEPGSLGKALILGDHALAYHCSHRLLQGEGENDIVKNLLEFAEANLPEESRGSLEAYSRWIDHQGLQGCTSSTITMMLVEQKLKGEEPWWELYSYRCIMA